MNLKTTLALLILVVAGGAFFWLGPLPSLNVASTTPDPVGAGTLTILEEELEPAQLSRVEIRHGDQLVHLERSPNGEWTLPGKWPTRKPEVEQLLGLLTGLRSRFAPIPLNDEELAGYGLDKPPVTITARAGEEIYVLAFGEPAESEETNRFSRPTYLRLGITTPGQVEWKPEVIRLAPGLIALLDRPADYYQQRRLFPSERLAKEDNPQEKVDRLIAQTVAVEEKKADGSKFTIDRISGDWVLTAPVRDRPDPDKLNAILNAVPDIWADQFVAKPKKDLVEYGLDKPEQVVRVTRPSGETVTLLIGKVAQTKTRTVMRPGPPVGQPTPPQPQIVHEEYRFAKLQDNDQIFEINADKLKDVFVSLDTLRDARLARFRAEDARRVEIDQKGVQIVLVKDKDRWKLEKPIQSDAESTKVTELLDKLANLRTGGKEDVLDKKEPKEYGLDAPAATIKVIVEEEVKGDKKAKKTRTFTVKLGKHDKDKSKLYAQLDGWERINAVEDSLLKLVERPALAYRGRRVFDFSRNNLDQVEVQRGDEKYRLKSVAGVWRLAEPVDAEADSIKTGQLAGDLGQLEAVEYTNDDPKPDDLEKKYGLAKPSLSAKLSFTDKDKPAQTLLIGKQVASKPEYYAKLEGAPAVFVVKKEIHDTLDQSSLAFRPTQLWQLQAEEIGELRVQRDEEPEYRLIREGEGEKAAWKVWGPFDAKVNSAQVRKMLTDLSQLRCERYESHTAKELEKYGLDKPHLKLTLVPAIKKDKDDKKKETEKEKEPAERILLIGKKTDKDPPSYFAKLGKGDAVVVIGTNVVADVDHAALDLLDRQLLKLDTKAITRIKSTSGDATLTLERKEPGWQVETGAAPAFKADGDVMSGYLGVWSVIQAQKFAAYGPKANLAKFGLDKPAITVTVTVQPADAKDKPVEHTIALGKEADGGRYARIDNGPGVAVLNGADASDLGKTYLDFVDRNLLKLDPPKVAAVARKMGEQELEVARKDDGWQIVKPAETKADAATLDALAEQLAHLRAVRVAAYPAKDLKAFGLDEPAGVVTLRLMEDGKPADRVLKLGKPVGDKSDDRFVQVDGSDIVAVMDGRLAKRLTAEPLKFRDRSLARFADADRVILERGPRKAVFAKVDGTWKLVEPVEAEAEQTDLEEFVNALARLRADELVAEKPEDLKQYGLDKPVARWRFQVGEKDVLGLLIGNHEKVDDKDGPRCYAKLTTGDLVFLLDPRLTTRALAEYRNRSLWPSLDAAQVDHIDYKYLRNPFTLEKVDNVWQVVGKPKLKVKSEAVSDALAALATLRAERIVVDKDADRKLYGLEPPQLVLEVRIPSGKRVLHIGLTEGVSKRHYARVVDEKRSDVFVLSEADAARIVRNLTAFTQGPMKPAAED